MCNCLTGLGEVDFFQKPHYFLHFLQPDFYPERAGPSMEVTTSGQGRGKGRSRCAWGLPSPGASGVWWHHHLSKAGSATGQPQREKTAFVASPQPSAPCLSAAPAARVGEQEFKADSSPSVPASGAVTALI